MYGVMPLSSNNQTVKWLWLAKPVVAAMSAMLNLLRSSSRCARRMRSRRTKWDGVKGFAKCLEKTGRSPATNLARAVAVILLSSESAT